MKNEPMSLGAFEKNYRSAVAHVFFRPPFASRLGWWCLATAIGTSGCARVGADAPLQAPESRQTTSTAAPSSDPVGTEQSIRPGVNDRYESAGALETYREIFEGERRDVVAHKAAILSALPLAPGAQVADIGAGTGLFTFDLARRVGPEGRVFAVDVSPTLLAALDDAVAEREAANVQVHAATPKRLGLPARSLDLALMSNVYHHVEYPFAYMPTVAEALRDDAELWLIDFERIEGVTSRRMLEHVRADKTQVITELERSGFRLVGEAQLGLEENYVLRFVPARGS